MKPSILPPMLQRVNAVNAAKRRFEGKPFKWGRDDCARLAAVTLAALGYKPAISRFGAYGSALTAYRRLKAHGFGEVDAWLDDIKGLARTPFAFALPGDILAMPGDGDRMGLAIYLGGNKMLAFAATPPHACVVHTMGVLPSACWKADPCRS